MSDILLSAIAPEGVEVTSCVTYGFPGEAQYAEISAHRIDVPTGIGLARAIRLTIAREMALDRAMRNANEGKSVYETRGFDSA